MDTISTIDGRWRLCAFVSFISIVILVICLNHGPDKVNLASVGNIAARTTSNNSSNQFPAPNKPFMESVYVKAHGKAIVKQKKEKCNIFDGKWVYDSKAETLYNGLQCPFLSDQVNCQRNGRPDFEYEKWKWESMEFEIPRFNGRDMLERLRGKRVIIVGDSLNRNQWESLACLLYSCLPPSQARVDTKSGTYKIFTAKDYNCSVEFYWSPFLVQLEANQANRSKILRLDKLSSSANKWQGADIMVFNTGHWWEHRGKMRAWDLFQYDGKLVQEMEIESAFEIAMKSWAYWIDNNVDKTKTTVFFRSISPEHKGKQWCFNKTKPLIDESYIPVFPKSISDIIERTIAGMETPVKYLNITKLSQYRTDAHPTIFSRKQGHQFNATKQKPSDLHADCSHWCLPGVPDTWNSLLYASIVFDISGVQRQL